MKTPRKAVMQRSSECIASLAAALAKAQIELANPEKSLLGSIKSETGNGPERVFRYASLSSGLEIVRKTLGQHEIATIQTTVIDQAAGIVNLTTVLAHASGEWIASDWPVCALSETARPHRMGAALTDLCPALCPVHPGRYRWGGRPRCTRSRGADRPLARFRQARGRYKSSIQWLSAAFRSPQTYPPQWRRHHEIGSPNAGAGRLGAIARPASHWANAACRW